MTLDFNQLALQIGKVGRDSFASREDQREKLSVGLSAMDYVASNGDKFLEKADSSQDHVLWPIARPLENVSEHAFIPANTTPVTVVAVDGSQIMPSHHEIHTCYLLNIGCVVISYGSVHRPILETRPRLYHRPEDLYPLVNRRRLHIDELYVSLERNLLELLTLVEISQSCLSRSLPVVALIDGSLIPWSVEKLSEKYQEEFLTKTQAALQQLQDSGIPVIGYLSSSRATDVVNMLRVAVCPYETSNCLKHCGALNEENFPCSKIWPLADRQLFLSRLEKGFRSSIFLSSAGVTKSWPHNQRICFAYVNVGIEIARIEFPLWLTKEPELLKYAIAVVVSQAEKGMGYPICLSEAHHLAVIRGPERQQFFDLLAARMIELGLFQVQVSAKEARKRVGFI